MYDDGWVEIGGATTCTGGNVPTNITLPVVMQDVMYSVGIGATINDMYDIQLATKTTTQIGFMTGYNGRYYTNGTFNWSVSGMSARGATQQNIVCIKY